MRVCHMISGDQWAGAEVMDYRLLQGLSKYKDLELSAILLNEGKVASEFRRLGVDVHVANESGQSYFRLAETVKNLVKMLSPDVLHSHRLKENILAYHAAKSGNHIRLICTHHGMPEPLSGKGKLLKRFILSKYHHRILSRHFHRVVVVSEDIRNRFLREYRFPNGKVDMIHNGTDIPPSRPEKKDSGDFVIGSAGRLFPVKDYPLMVRVAGEISRRTSGTRFELAGEGPEKERILGLIREEGLETVFALNGFLDDISRFYASLDLYINTSLHEGIPMSVLEAMSYGLPVIAPDTGGLAEIIENGRHGYLVQGRDPRAFADNCLRLIENRSLLQELGDASREKIRKEFSFDNMSEKYRRLYQAIN